MAMARSGDSSSRRAVDVRAKDGRLLGDFRVLGQAEELKAAAVGEDRAVPAHEAVQAAQIADHVFARPQRQMIGVAQDHLRTGRAHLVDRQGFDGCLRAHRHERRQLDRGRAACGTCCGGRHSRASVWCSSKRNTEGTGGPLSAFAPRKHLLSRSERRQTRIRARVL